VSGASGQLTTDSSLSKLGPEDRLCLWLARAQLSAAVQHRISELLGRPLHWPLLLERARIYDILPLLFHNLHPFDFAGVPDLIRAELARIFAVNGLRNELLAQEFARILRLLDEARIPVVVLKGIALAESLYGDLALRTCADLDVLVPARDFTKAFNLILSSGYEPEFNAVSMLSLVARFGKDSTLTRHDGERVYHLELHCGLFWGGPLERSLLEEIWADAHPTVFRGVPALALSADWQFLYLAQHAARHGPPSLKWLLDLDRLCRAPAVDWESVSARARRLGWDKAIASSLLACASLFDTPLGPPYSSMTPVQPRDARAPQYSDFQVPSEVLFSLGLLKTWTVKAQYLAIRLFIPTPADCRLMGLPAALFFLYYVLRPIRVACTALGWLGRFVLSKVGLSGGSYRAVEGDLHQGGART